MARISKPSGRRCLPSLASVRARWLRSTAPRCPSTNSVRLWRSLQVHIGRILRVNQAAVSKMVRRTDMYVSTLQDFIKAMGGELKITAKFPDGTVEISQFADARKAAAGKG